MGNSIEWDFQVPEPSELIPDGTCCVAHVTEATLGLSSKGNDSFKLKVAAMGEDGKVRRHLYEYITLTEKAAWKTNQFIQATGMATDGGQISLSEEGLTGLTGNVRIKIDSYVDKNGEEQTTNKIDRWLSPSQAAA